jgi:tetratricopeptide (TPR) repeat protein
MQPDQIAEKIRETLATAKALQAGGRFEDARRACDLILKVDPQNRRVRLRLGLIANAEGRYEEAARHFGEAVELDATDAYALRMLAMASRQAGMPERAEAALDRAMPNLPPDVELLLEKARCRIDRDAASEAVPYLEEAVALAPEHGQANSFLGIARRSAGDRQGAFTAFQTALILNPRDVAALNGIGNDLLERELFDEALTYYQRALELQPGFQKAHKNLAYTLSLTDNASAARACFDDLLTRYPNYAEARMDYGLFLLSSGDYIRGWQEFEGRWSFDGYREPDWSAGLPRWDGAPLHGRRLLLWGEQGIGDHILYGTMLPAIIRLADGPVTIAVEKRLVPLFARSLETSRVRVVERGQSVDADLQCPFGSIGSHLGAAPHDGSGGRYLKVDPGRVASLRARYTTLAKPGDRLVGLSWRSINWHIGAYKSLDLKALLPVLQKPGITWISLQYGDVSREIAKLAARKGIVIHQDPDIDATNDLDGLAAQIVALDGVVSTSNSTVHFAGGLGKPCWVLLPFGRGRMWYWPRHGIRTPWYESLRLMRQEVPGDWSAVLRDVGEALDDRT